MKSVLPLFAFLFIAFMASCQSVADIKFASSTRGFNKEIVITPKTISLYEQDYKQPDKEKNTTWPIPKGEWKKVLESIEGVLLQEMPLLKAPSNKRAYDGAKASMITITDKKGETWSHSFDDQTPNDALMPLMKVITELTAGK